MIDLYEAERAHHRIADHQATDAHLRAHERHQLPATLLQPLLGVVGAGRVVRRRRWPGAALVAHRHHCAPPTDRRRYTSTPVTIAAARSVVCQAPMCVYNSTEIENGACRRRSG